MLIPDNMKKRFENILKNNLCDWGGDPICEDRFYSRAEIRKVALLIAKQAVAWAMSEDK